MKIAIVGWGEEAQSAYKYFGPDNEYLIVNEEPRSDFPAESAKLKLQFIKAERTPGLTGNVKDLSYLDGVDKYDQIVYSVTAYPNLKQRFGANPTFWAKATTVNHIFFEKVKSHNIIGVTGSKGKGTTSTLIAKLLESAGHKVHLGGNIGRSVLEFLDQVEADDWVVLELSNFQLKDLPYSPHIAVCLMITEEHLDWHSDMEDYIQAKANLFRHQRADDIAIYYGEDANSKRIASYSPGKQIPYYKQPGAWINNAGQIILNDQPIIAKTEVKLLGEHNLQNICAALTAVYEAIGNIDSAKTVLASFSGLEHRLEFVRELEGIKYYDDSFATTPQATIVALKAFPQPKVVVLGGHDKGLDFSPLIDEVTRGNIRQVITIGKTGPKLAQMLKEKGYDSIVSDNLSNMDGIVAAARKAAQAGDVVLLSTACASFGMFQDYKQRGDLFKQAVRALA